MQTLLANSRFEPPATQRAVAVALASKCSPRGQLINHRAKYVLKKAPDALEHTCDLVLEKGRETPLQEELLNEASVMAAVEVAFEAHVPWLEQALEVPGTQLKFGRGGCSKWSGQPDMMARPLVHTSSKESDTGSHSTNEGCLPAYSRFMLIGDGEDVAVRNVANVKEKNKGFSYELLQKAEKKAVELARDRFGADKVKNKASGDNGREQFAPHRYIYVNVCRPSALQDDPVHTPPRAAAAAHPAKSCEERLQAVKRVLDQRLITADEAATKRQRILDEM